MIKYIYDQKETETRNEITKLAKTSLVGMERVENTGCVTFQEKLVFFCR